MDSPTRVQRQRTKGWRMPENTVYVGRPSKWGNPFIVGVNVENFQEAIDGYKEFLKESNRYPAFRESLNALRGKNLACWCPLDQPCHADVLLELANRKIAAWNHKPK